MHRLASALHGGGVGAWPRPSSLSSRRTGWARRILILLECLAVTVPLLVAVAYMTYVDRKVWASIQLRRGPNVVGPFGLLQPFADGLKLVLKETIVPSSANGVLFLIAPMITFMTALIAWAVVPFDDGWVIADINVGILYLFAISSLGVYGVIIAGWASNSKYAFLGALRSAAQMVSYEVSIGFVLITVLLCVGSLNLTKVVLAQSGWFWNWFWLPLLPMFVIFFISALAETNRTPFDLPMSEAELVPGFHTEYSAMTFAPVLPRRIRQHDPAVGDGRRAVPGRLDVAGPVSRPSPGCRASIWFALKIAFLLFVFSWTKGTLPRYRYDQLMRLGWKVFLPVSLGWVVLTAAVLQFGGWVPKLLGRSHHGLSRPHRARLPALRAGGRLRAHPQVHVQAQGDGELSLREGTAQPALPRRACAAPLSQRRGTLHRLQALRGDLPGAGHHHRGRAARRRQPAHDALRHRHDQVHLLRLLPGSLPGRCHRRGAELRVLDRDPRGADVQQGQAARERRPLGGEIAANLAADAAYR